ncbi:unnamed protein product [Arctia plantaginis]|uniref:Uncharacterized protein n=1 Tax=Arctia plantaginis TaxID=874455 RepID=A0A8S0ZIS3_ARCPL|nr:unnamed protein product [Arctia plantaginis]
MEDTPSVKQLREAVGQTPEWSEGTPALSPPLSPEDARGGCFLTEGAGDGHFRSIRLRRGADQGASYGLIVESINPQHSGGDVIDVLKKGVDVVSLGVGANLGRGFAATKDLLRTASREGISLLLLQEPYVGATKKLEVSGAQVFQGGAGNEPTKAAVVVLDDRLRASMEPDCAAYNMVGIRIFIEGLCVGAVSVYLEGDSSLDEDLSKLKTIKAALRTDLLPCRWRRECQKSLVGQRGGGIAEGRRWRSLRRRSHSR